MILSANCMASCAESGIEAVVSRHGHTKATAQPQPSTVLWLNGPFWLQSSPDGGWAAGSVQEKEHREVPLKEGKPGFPQKAKKKSQGKKYTKTSRHAHLLLCTHCLVSVWCDLGCCVCRFTLRMWTAAANGALLLNPSQSGTPLSYPACDCFSSNSINCVVVLFPLVSRTHKAKLLLPMTNCLSIRHVAVLVSLQ